MSRRILCSLGAGPSAELLAIARPSFSAFAARHRYELVLEDRVRASDRAAPWSKLALLRELLEASDEVLWIDADAVIVDGRLDVATELEGDESLGLVEHAIGAHRVPSTGVLLLRPAPVVLAALDAAWAADDLRDHPWYDQAAIARLLGYSLPATLAPGGRGRAARTARRLTGRDPRPARRGSETPLRAVTRLLDPAWNAILTARPVAHPRIRHWPGEPHAGRIAKMTRAAAEAV